MAISFVSKGATGAGVGAVTPGLPAGHTTDDILILLVESANQAITTPSGYTLIGSANNGGTGGTQNATRLSAFWKRDGGSETAPSVADTGNHTTAVLLCFRGCVASGTPLDAAAVTDNTGGSEASSIAFPAITNAGAGAMMVFAVSDHRDYSEGVGFEIISTIRSYSGFTDKGVVARNSNALDGCIAAAYGIAAAAGTTFASPSATFTPENSDFMAVMVFGLAPIPPTTSAAVGTLTKMSGAASVLNKDAIAAVGTLTKMSGAASVLNKDAIAAVGTLTKMSGAAIVTEKNTVAVAGALPAMQGAVNLLETDTSAITGALAAMTGAATLSQLPSIDTVVSGTLAPMGGAAVLATPTHIAVTATMGPMSGEAAALLGQHIAAAGRMGAMSGSASGTVHLPDGAMQAVGALAAMSGTIAGNADDTIRHVAHGALKAISGAVDFRRQNVAVRGALKGMSGAAVLSSGSPATCYDIADDRRELILARLATVLAGVAGVVSFKRNDPTVVESQMPCVLLFDGDEAASVPHGWGKGRPAPFPMLVAAHPEVYIMVDDSGEEAGNLLNTLQDRIVKAVLNDAELRSLCVDQWLLYEGSQVAFALGRALEGEMGVNFTFNYLLDPKDVCAPLADVPGWTKDTIREAILSAMARAVESAEGVAYFRRNEISRPEEASPAVFMLDGDEFVDPDLYKPGRPPNVPKPATADPEVYAVVNADPLDVGPSLNRLRLMVLRTALNDPLLTRLAADGDIRYEGTQTGLALGRSMAGEMGLKFSVRYVLNPN